MRVCSLVVLSYLDAGFEPQCRRKDFGTTCLLRTLGPKKGCKTSTWQTQLGNQYSRLGASWVLVLANTLEITVEQSPLAV